ncbi:MAG: rRNA maturation RNase YbeY [Bacteroidetes bacterium]|nr:rRNA maturation RNase YbeY [Bacteroidota bacterium]
MSSLLQFFSEEVDFKLSDEKVIHDWIIQSISQEKQNTGVLNIIFCTDEYLLDLNQRFLHRETLTDVIAFDYRENEDEVSGDIFISAERAEENALRFNQSFEFEIFRIIIHGVLHLLSYSDKSSADQSIMTDKEDYYLSLLPQ